ncbi:MAG TPA: hypothetical protein VHL34_22710 [Rhizomicrobium sp.]|jgi:hypothetical protein|nr:hypothetical protein [Rhizomicrobium sp.]
MNWRKIRKWSLIVAAVPVSLAALLGTALAYPEPFFAYHTERGRLAVYSDQPFDTAKAQTLLAHIDERVSRSPLDTHQAHAIFVANSEWRRRIFMNVAAGAGGVNFYPVTRNVFLRTSDIDHNKLIRPNGTPAENPRTLTYYGAHEIGHSLTGEARGMAHLWNWRLPAWVREGYADYVGLGGRGQIDITAYYKRYRAHDPHFLVGSGFYDRYRMLTYYFLDRKGWSVQRLLDCNLTIDEAQTLMDADMAKSG